MTSVIVGVNEKMLNPDALKEWKIIILKNIDTRISFYSRNTHLLPPKPKISFCHLKRGIQDFHMNYVLVPADKYILKRVSFGNKDCTEELKLECAYSWARLASFCHLGFTSDPLIVSKFHNETHDPKGQEHKIYTIVKGRETLLTMLFEDCIISILLSVSLLTTMPINCSLL